MNANKILSIIEKDKDLPVYFLYDTEISKVPKRKGRFALTTSSAIRKAKILHDFKLNQIFIKDRDMFFMKEEIKKDKSLLNIILKNGKEDIDEVIYNYIENLCWTECILISPNLI